MMRCPGPIIQPFHASRGHGRCGRRASLLKAVLRAVGSHPQQNRCMVSDFGDVGISGAAALAEPEI